MIERAAKACVDEHYDDDQEEESEQSMYCITCGHEIHSRTAIRHMEKCFNKVCWHFVLLLTLSSLYQMHS